MRKVLIIIVVIAVTMGIYNSYNRMPHPSKELMQEIEMLECL